MEGSKVRYLTEEDFNAIALKENEPVLVDFWAPWCGPCKVIGPVIEELAEEYDGRAKVCKVNVDEQSKIAHEYGVMSIPTVMIFKNGALVDKVVGSRDKQDYRKMIDSYLG
jgi:thioredoxin 1